jgi:hypothetical protein
MQKAYRKNFSDVSIKYEESDTEYLKQYDARIDAERDKVKRKLKDAIEAQDAEQIMESNDSLTKTSR